MILVEKWLKGNRNFIVGKHLYKTFGNDKALVALFDKGETAFAKTALVKALEAIAAGGRPGAAKAVEPGLMIMPKGNDAVLNSITEEWQPKYMRMNFLRHELDKYGTSNSPAVVDACKKLCTEILSLEKEINQLWQKKDFYNVHGRLPDVKEKEIEIPTDPVKLANFINSCARQIRRYKTTALSNPHHAQLMEDYKHKYKLATGKDYAEKN